MLGGFGFMILVIEIENGEVFFSSEVTIWLFFDGLYPMYSLPVRPLKCGPNV